MTGRTRDVPCDALMANPGGSYTQQKDLMMGTMPTPKKTYDKDTAEVGAWDQKCGGNPDNAASVTCY